MPTDLLLLTLAVLFTLVRLLTGVLPLRNGDCATS